MDCSNVTSSASQAQYCPAVGVITLKPGGTVASQTNGGTLPLTGWDLGLVLLVAALLIAVGVAMRATGPHRG